MWCFFLLMQLVFWWLHDKSNKISTINVLQRNLKNIFFKCNVYLKTNKKSCVYLISKTKILIIDKKTDKKIFKRVKYKNYILNFILAISYKKWIFEKKKEVYSYLLDLNISFSYFLTYHTFWVFALLLLF